MTVETKPYRQSEKHPYFEEATSAAVVNSRMGPDVSPRMRAVMGAVVKHLHAAVKEIEPTHEEWLAAIKFLTDTGHMCTDWRQEFILLSDTLGVSMLVDAVNHRRPNGATENTILGPFYLPDAPRYGHGANICLDGKGEPLVVTGRVLDTAGNPIAGATIDVWQTNEDGFYDVQQKGVQPDFNLRGVFTSDAGGPLLVPVGQAALLPDPGRRACRQDAESARPTSVSGRPHPLHRDGARIRSGDHPHLHARLRILVRRRGVRGEGNTDWRLPAHRRCGPGRNPRHRQPVLVRRMGLHARCQVTRA